MFNGVKNIEGGSYKTTKFQKFYGVIWIIVPIMVFFASLIFQKKDITEKHTKQEHHESRYNE